MKIFLSVCFRLFLTVVPTITLIYGAENFDYFDYAIVELGFPSWNLVSYFSRILLGGLIGIGVAILFSGNRNRKLLLWYLGLSLVMLMIAILQATILPLNRTYFGLWELFKWNVWQGPLLWFSAVISSFLIIRTDKENYLNAPNWVRILLVIVGISMPFILNYPPQWAVYGEKGITESQNDLMVDSLVNVKSDYLHLMNPADLKSGKKLICFASLTCPFCIRAAYKLHVLKKRNPEAQCYMILTGDPSILKLFEQRTSCENVPRMLLNEPLFNKITGGGVPKIYLVDEGKITHRLPYWAIQDEHVQ
jgi:hypothetical protein